MMMLEKLTDEILGSLFENTIFAMQARSVSLLRVFDSASIFQAWLNFFLRTRFQRNF